ncbi:MAG: gamma-glutamyltransferase [Fimbriimonadaceae bacterium]|nr:gamma-glutamyltransferase [Fimbriimonadaceae bacterium]
MKARLRLNPLLASTKEKWRGVTHSTGKAFRLCKAAALIVAIGWASPSAQAQSHAPQYFEKACVVSDSAIASQIGAEVMRKGGNAVDGAVATAFALAVTHPTAGNIGGGGFMVVRMADGRTIAIDYRETAPAASSREMYMNAPQPGASLTGQMASGVPGTVYGMYDAHKQFGKLPWKDVVEPARKLAQNGFVVSKSLADELKSQAARFRPFPDSYRVLNKDGKFWGWGETLKLPDLAKTLGRIRDEGPAGFYEGETAKLIVAEMKRGNGIITLEDLKNYRSVSRQPLKASAFGYDIITMPPPSSGGIALVQMLNILSGYELKPMGWGSVSYNHILIETMKRAFADRAYNSGDPAFFKVPTQTLTSMAYADSLREAIKLDKATPSAEIKPFDSGIKEGDHTTHFSVVDQWGNAVANTYTLNTGYGSGVMVTGAGFLLNNEMDDFMTAPGKPNVFGLIQGENNAIAPGKRPVSSMTPTIVLKEGELSMVIGSPGGPTIINTVMQTFLNVALFNMDIQRAVSAPRIHHQWMPDSISWESFGVAPDTKKMMESMGHKFAARPSNMGSCMSILVDSNGNRRAGVDARSDDAGAAGF